MNNQLESTLEKLKNNNLWFTTDLDPVIPRPPYFYNLDEYGYPIEKDAKKIIKQIENYIGDGAAEFGEAEDLWIEEALSDGRLFYTDNLVTKFKPKPVIDDIQMYDQFSERGVLNESNDSIDDLINKDNHKEITSAPEDLDRWKKYVKLAKALGMNDKKISQNIINMTHNSNLAETALNKKAESKINKKAESKSRLEEENKKSLDTLSNAITAVDFDSDSKQGQIILRTQELFNVLSSNGFDVEVTVDNGETESDIILGKQGGKVVITITETDSPLRAFISGNIEINDENLKQLGIIQDQISVL